jgi:sulfate adenylyltransferase subunit 2
VLAADAELQTEGAALPTLGLETKPVGSPPKLSHLQRLEAESIHIFREVAAEFEKPVMLYSIGKDSSVMLRLAQKAFYPGPIPFPLLHIDTGYKFKEMIAFRDEYTRRLGVELLVWRNEAAIADGATPIALVWIVEDHSPARRPARARL